MITRNILRRSPVLPGKLQRRSLGMDFLNVTPTGRQQCIPNAEAATVFRERFDVLVRRPTSPYIGPQLMAARYQDTGIQNQIAQLRVEKSNGDGLADVMNFPDFSEESHFLHIGLLAVDVADCVQSTYCGLSHTDKVLRSDTCICTCTSICAIGHPDRNTDGSNGAYGLHPRRCGWVYEYAQDLFQAEQHVEYSQKCKNCNGCQNYPVGSFELLECRGGPFFHTYPSQSLVSQNDIRYQKFNCTVSKEVMQ